MTHLAALVVTYNRLEKLKATLAALLADGPEVLDAVVVIDNASTDGTGDWLAGHADPRLDRVTLQENSGGAGGFAAGLARIREQHDPDWTVLMDDDARPEPGTLARFAGQRRDEAEAWMAATYLPDGSIAEMNRPWVNPFWHPSVLLRSVVSGRAGFHIPDECFEANKVLPVDGGSFVGLFLSRAALQLVPDPDPGLFVYGDDVLYTLALTRRGGRILFDSDLVFHHDCQTLEGDIPRFDPLWKAYYYHRNQLFVYREAAGPLLFWPVLLIKWFTWRSRARRYGAERSRYLRVLRQAIHDGIRNRRNRTLAEARKLSA